MTPGTRNGADQLVDFVISQDDTGLSKVTLAQIRAFYLVARYDSVAQAAKALGKNHVDVKRQIRSLDEHVEGLTKSRIYRDGGERGKILITKEGREIEQLCANILGAVCELDRTKKAATSKTARIGLTTFLLELVHELVSEFPGRRSEYITQLVHLRTGKLESAVVEGEVDFAFGGRVTGGGQAFEERADLTYRELKTDSFSFLTNYDLNGLEPKTVDDLVKMKIPVVLPTQGIVYNMIQERLGCSSTDEIEDVLNVVEWCDDVHFAFEIMRLRIHDCGMFILTGVFEHYKRFYSDGSKSENIKLWGLEDIDLKSSVVFLTRKDKIEHLADDHHLRKCHDDIVRWLGVTE